MYDIQGAPCPDRGVHRHKQTSHFSASLSFPWPFGLVLLFTTSFHACRVNATRCRLVSKGIFYHVNLNPLAVVLNGLFSLRLTSLILRINLTVHTHAHVHNIQCPKNETLRRLMIIERKITTVYSYCCTKSSSFSSFADKKVDRGL